ncbi:MAG: hypothetical protein AAB531_03305 [Patescibacteria group bacterium]
MKKKYFYSHLVNIKILSTELDGLNISITEKEELLDLAHKNIHHEVMDTIASSLEGEDNKKFLELVEEGEHEKVWLHIKEKTKNVEEKIKQAVDQIRKELIEDIKKIKEPKTN